MLEQRTWRGDDQLPVEGRSSNHFEIAFTESEFLLDFGQAYGEPAEARDALKPQRLLGQAMRILEDTPVMPAGILNQGGPESDTFNPNETVDVVMETITVYDMGAIWDVSKPNIQPSVGYVARMIGL